MAALPLSSLRLYIITAFATAAMLGSCTLFSTRTPEDPITNRSAHQVPTSPDIVVQNLLTAIREKNSANYTSCFVSDSIAGIPTLYTFQPSADAQSLYPALFGNWSVENEQRYFASLLLDLASTTIPSVELQPSASTIVEPSVSTYTYDYTLTPQQKAYRGKMRLTIIRLPNGNWAIHQWTDESLPNQQTQQTWSFLKAAYGN